MPIGHGHHPYQYNDFVAPLESEDLIKAVDVKQNLYDQGTAAIDAKMHELAGFDIAREQDREYANQELKKIYSVIQNNASKDFSNPQIVRSFLDVARPLENDPRFKNAKDSTAELRNRQSTLDQIRTKHPDQYSAANEYHYMKDIAAWQNDPNAGAVLNHKEYTPYKDISKKVAEIMKFVKPDAQLQMKDIGKWLTTESVISLSNEKVKNAVLSQLSADEVNQLQIDANFQSANTDPRTKFTTVSSALQRTAQNNMELSRIRGIENTTGYTQAQHAQMAKSAMEQMKTLNNPETLDALYANAHISDFVDGIGNAYSYRNISQKIQQDPYAFMHEKTAADLSAFKQKALLEHQYRTQEINTRGEWSLKVAGLKGKKSVDVPLDQLKFFGIQPSSRIIAGVKYPIDFTDENMTVGGINAGTKMQEILTEITKNNSNYNIGDWLNPDGNVNSNVHLSYKVNDKGVLEYEISAPDPNSTKEGKTVDITIPAKDMGDFLGNSGAAGDINYNTEEFTPDQLELFHQMFGGEEQ